MAEKSIDGIKIDLGKLVAVLAIASMVFGAVLWLSDVKNRACVAEELSRKNASELSRVEALNGRIGTLEQILLRIEQDMKILKGRP